MSEVTVTLSWADVEIAAYAGMKRRVLALRANRPDRYGFDQSDPWGTDIESAASELAVARHLELPWTPWADRPQDVQADVGEDVQVRRRKQRGWKLILHHADLDEHLFVLVTGRAPTFTLHGWVAGRDGKNPDCWGDPFGTGRPAFWYPQERLEPMETIDPKRNGKFDYRWVF